MEKFPLLDIIIGLSLIYTFLSLLASGLVEFVVVVLRWRTQYLKQIIITLMGESLERGDDPDQFKNTIAGKLLDSSQIISATQPINRRNRSIVLPEVSPQVFANALLDVLQSLPQPDDPGTNHKSAPTEAIVQLKAIIRSSPDLSPQLKENLQRIIDRAQSIEPNSEYQLLRVKYEIGLWFSHAMVLAPNTYKLHFKMVSFFVSLGLVMAINVDSLYIIRRISENTATRAVILQNATRIQGCQNSLNSPRCKEHISLLMESTTLPIGWQASNRRKQFAQLNHIIILRTIGGWFLTSLAVAMGSHFWLRLLRQFSAFWSKDRKPN
ncbi:hypothetical protein K9N68_37920 (plasmid) [Kovacikia minuta CCNUW1]|uniref:hypothetical protein n=1 Tax=Kovacikia minuta TaxID=2931930 RepID=UPI001CCC72F6|nr:hypothetical protein [Kovacikia minuta]UBF29984.1 hypothetical protein K9N68_37920 [Kovacikia minuta CCNUW1]